MLVYGPLPAPKYHKMVLLRCICIMPPVGCRSNVSLVVLVVEGTRGIEFMSGIILSVVIANWVAHHIHHDGVYESELERIGNLYFLRDEPPHRCGGCGSSATSQPVPETQSQASPALLGERKHVLYSAGC